MVTHPGKLVSSLFVLAALGSTARAGGPLPCPRLDASGPWAPGAAQELVLSGARPGAWVGLFVGEPGCATVLDSNHLLELARADPDGVARWSVRVPAELAGVSVQLTAWSVGETAPGGTLAASVGLGDADFFIDCEGTSLVTGSQYNPPNGVPLLMQGYSIGPGPLSSLNDVHIGNAVGFWAYNGTTVIAGHGEIVVSRIDGAAFSIKSFDLAGFPGNFEVPFSVVSSSGAVASFVPDGLVDGPGGAEDFETFTLPPTGFQNVASISFIHTGPGTNVGTFHIDDLVLKPGPAGIISLSGGTSFSGGSNSSGPDPSIE